MDFSEIKFSRDDLDWIFSPDAIREQAGKIFDRMSDAGRTHFFLHMDKFPDAARRVLDITKRRFPDLKVPTHSRWAHFDAGGVERVAALEMSWSQLDKKECARRLLDLVVVSVLLDAGAGSEWSYHDINGADYSRSEGLAVASLRMFEDGLFSHDKGNPHQVSAEGLLSLTGEQLAAGFQLSEENKIVGLEGRLNLLQSLGKIIKIRKKAFVGGRIGGLIDYWEEEFVEGFSGPQLLRQVLDLLGPIWPSRITLGNNPLGDVWYYGPFGDENKFRNLVPFHKLSQWLTYSLRKPVETAGIKVTQMERLTGLPEYRNGGLFLDAGVLEIADPAMRDQSFSPDHPLIIEWRAATIILLDKTAEWVRKELKMSEIDFPLGSVLEGGSWWAGREIAKEKRKEGTPPLNIISDGTVF